MQIYLGEKTSYFCVECHCAEAKIDTDRTQTHGTTVIRFVDNVREYEMHSAVYVNISSEFSVCRQFFYMLWLSSPKVISSDVKSSSTNQKLRKTTWEESANLYPLYLGRTVYRTSHIHIFIIEMKTEPTQMFAATTISSIHNRISNHFFGTNRIERIKQTIYERY